MVHNPDAPTLEQHRKQIAKSEGWHELLKLEREIAEETARSDIECHCLQSETGWWDTAEEEGDLLKKSVRYLELRGLIERHPDDPDTVRFA